LEGAPNGQFEWKPGGKIEVDEIEARFDVERPVTVKRIKYRLRFDSNGQGTGYIFKQRIAIRASSVWYYTDEVDVDVVGWEQWVEVSHTFSVAHDLQGSGECLQNEGYVEGSITAQRVIIDNLRFYPD
jgi:hypothetical protein